MGFQTASLFTHGGLVDHHAPAIEDPHPEVLEAAEIDEREGVVD